MGMQRIRKCATLCTPWKSLSRLQSTVSYGTNFKKAVLAKHTLVDKSLEVSKFLLPESQNFIARPRKSGKTLAITMAYSILNGEEDLFAGSKLENALKNNDPDFAHDRSLFDGHKNYRLAHVEYNKKIQEYKVLVMEYERQMKKHHEIKQSLPYKFKLLVGLDVPPEPVKPFKPEPIVVPLHLDFALVKPDPSVFESALVTYIQECALEQLNINLQSHNDPQSVIRNVYSELKKQNKKLALLVDEYDHPIVKMIENNGGLMGKNVENNLAVLRNFFTVVKSCHGTSGYCVMITGVSKFSFTSLFSGANTIQDVSFSKEFRTAFHFTWNEIQSTYSQQLNFLVDIRKSGTLDSLKEELTKYYGGFEFDWNHSSPDDRLFNPFDISSLMESASKRDSGLAMWLPDYWISKGKSGFLGKLLDFDYLFDGFWNKPVPLSSGDGIMNVSTAKIRNYASQL